MYIPSGRSLKYNFCRRSILVEVNDDRLLMPSCLYDLGNGGFDSILVHPSQAILDVVPQF